MQFAVVKIVFLKELREMLRDRRSLIVMFGVPLLLYPLLTIGISGLMHSQERRLTDRVYKVAVQNGAWAPHLLDLMSAPASGVTPLSRAAPEDQLRINEIDAVLRVPLDAQERAVAGKQVEFTLVLDRSRPSAPFVEKKLERLLHDYEKWVIEQRLSSRGVSPAVLQPLGTRTQDIATGDQRLGSLVGRVLPLLLLMTGMLGAFFPALNATTTEREHGTLEALLVTPAGRMELLVAKGAMVLLGGLLTAALNMASMMLVLWRVFAAQPRMPENLTMSPATLMLAYLAAVPTIVFFASIVLVVGLMARTYREANSYATPVMLLPLIAGLASLTELKTTPGMLVTPILNTTVIVRDVMTGRAPLGAFVLAFVSSCLYAGLLLSVATRLFSNEQLVNPAWEPLSIRGLGRAKRRRSRLPAVDEVLALFAATLLLVLYVEGPLVQARGLLVGVFVAEAGLIAAPAVLLAWWARYSWSRTFAWRWPSLAIMAGAAALGVGLVPWTGFLFDLQNQYWPADPQELQQITNLFLPTLERHLVLTPILVGVMAGVCEELLYRGPIQTALLRRLPVGVALTAGAVLFAAAHLDLHGFLVRALLGGVLGWAVWRSGSIFPAMVLHGLYDMGQLAQASFEVYINGKDEVMARAMRPEVEFNDYLVYQLAVGALLIVLGLLVFRGRRRRRNAAHELAPAIRET